MSDPFATPDSLDPDAAFTQGRSVAQAANDLRVAAGEKAREFANTASTQASAFKERAVESANHFREVATEKADAFKHAATDKAQHLRETATERWEESREKAHEFQVTAEDYIRQNPTKAVVGALGVGFLVGLILRR